MAVGYKFCSGHPVSKSTAELWVVSESGPAIRIRLWLEFKHSYIEPAYVMKTTVIREQTIPIVINSIQSHEAVPALRVLLAEDDALIGFFLAEILEGLGFDVCAIAVTEADTVTSAALYKPDIMIIDAHLGNGSGIVAVETILRAGFIPHVFASGDPSSILAHMPAAIVIQKPFRESELILAIQEALAAQATS